MINVKLLLFHTVADQAGRREADLQVAPGATVADAFMALQKQHPALIMEPKTLAFTRNEEYVPTDSLISDGDEIGVLPPVSGG
jgi:molybdopterin converting factor small subunit